MIWILVRSLTQRLIGTVQLCRDKCLHYFIRFWLRWKAKTVVYLYTLSFYVRTYWQYIILALINRAYLQSSCFKSIQNSFCLLSWRRSLHSSQRMPNFPRYFIPRSHVTYRTGEAIVELYLVGSSWVVCCERVRPCGISSSGSPVQSSVCSSCPLWTGCERTKVHRCMKRGVSWRRQRKLSWSESPPENKHCENLLWNILSLKS